MAFISGYNNRKLAHWVNNNVLDSNYQVTINPQKTTGSDSGEDVFFGSSVRDDFDDFRLTKADESTLLDQWQESLTSGTEARYWGEIHKVGSSLLTGNASSAQKDVVVSDATVFAANDYVILIDNNGREVCKIASKASNTLTMESNLVNSYTTAASAKVAHAAYLYYNNSSATLLSSGDDTFIFFDHFPGVAIDTNKWAGGTAKVTVASSIATFTGTSAAWVLCYGKTVKAGNVRARFRANLPNTSYPWISAGYQNQSPSEEVLLYTLTGFNTMKVGVATSLGTDTGGYGAYHLYDFCRLNSGTATARAFKDNVQTNGGDVTTNVATNDFTCKFGAYGNTTQCLVDWCFLANYTYALTWGAWGDEICSLPHTDPYPQLLAQ